MGAGISKERLRGALYRSLKKTERELAQAGVPVVYRDKHLEDPRDRSHFHVRHEAPLRASNGECAVFLEIEITVACVVERYTRLHGAHGLFRIKTVYGDASWRARRHESDICRLITVIETAVRERIEGSLPHGRRCLYMHDAEGKQGRIVYAYNEVKDGRPMLRLDDGLYHELLPGMSVRTEDGTVIAERPRLVTRLPDPPPDVEHLFLPREG